MSSSEVPSALSRRFPAPKKKLHLLNEEIPFSEVLLVVPDGENKTLELGEAVKMAKEAGLDLVLINDKAQTPIVKILDYGKFLYELKKNERHKKHVVKVKSITVKPQISDHDITWKANMAIEWFKAGDKVQFVVKAFGRMGDRMDLINEVYEVFSSKVEEFGKSKEGLKKVSKNQYTTFFLPVKK